MREQNGSSLSVSIDCTGLVLRVWFHCMKWFQYGQCADDFEFCCFVSSHVCYAVF